MTNGDDSSTLFDKSREIGHKAANYLRFFIIRTEKPNLYSF